MYLAIAILAEVKTKPVNGTPCIDYSLFKVFHIFWVQQSRCTYLSAAVTTVWRTSVYWIVSFTESKAYTSVITIFSITASTCTLFFTTCCPKVVKTCVKIVGYTYSYYKRYLNSRKTAFNIVESEKRVWLKIWETDIREHGHSGKKHSINCFRKYERIE